MSPPTETDTLAGRTGAGNGKTMTLHEALILAGALSRIGDAARACDMANTLWPEHRWQWQDESRSVVVLLPVMPPPPEMLSPERKAIQ
jgi:hypothetical protein